MNTYTPENITKLRPKEIFVFGSNYPGGRHGKGAAKFAMQKFGAVYGVAEGLTGKCYALPTVCAEKTGPLSKMPLEQISIHVGRFIKCAQEHPELTFLLTQVGCGLAGYQVEDIAPMFLYSPLNVIKPIEFENVIADMRPEFINN